jgi:hypothetical protein
MNTSCTRTGRDCETNRHWAERDAHPSFLWQPTEQAHAYDTTGETQHGVSGIEANALIAEAIVTERMQMAD